MINLLLAFDGLIQSAPSFNGADPLAQLRDIQLPEPVGIWPPAPGWWILGLIILSILFFGFWKFKQYKAVNQYRHDAIALIKAEEKAIKEHKNITLYLQNMAEILRRTALTAYPNERIEPLQGNAWLAFLDGKNYSRIIDKPHLSFQKGCARDIIFLTYQTNEKNILSPKDLSAIHNTILFWVKYHSRNTDVTLLSDFNSEENPFDSANKNNSIKNNKEKAVNYA